MDVTLARITLFPIKALDGIEVTQVEVLPSGALKSDREFAMRDADGNFINGKKNARVHQLRTTYDLEASTVSFHLSGEESSEVFHLTDDLHETETFLSDFFSQKVSIDCAPDTGFPDDTDSPGPTIISTQSLEVVASWFPEMTTESARRRFRTSLELSAPEPFWEDQLFEDAEELIRFRIGNVEFAGVNPCQRCVVPSRNPDSGEAISAFAKTFATQREETLPAFVNQSRFNHYFRLAVNTRLIDLDRGNTLHVGDVVTLLNG
ncbi:MOSC domain-containing protein [Calycomorphotria hydatis]|uniref:MOSC domain-containing protein n=1 Tax=Calycomorphotria hydatis TaxID=2528027 RepID=A0A517T7W3_9PLAN|nr:MOSC N-terminal beta barrel domain-containing protein [Calycomorphotria hydatis]QDT64464.1 hypothetical protein V22_16980 [Calycomorphotria hydatis]